MKTFVLLAALAFPCAGFSATLTGSLVDSTAAVNLSSVGTLDWARWPGYKTKIGAISNVRSVGKVKNYTTDARIIGDASGIKVTGLGSYFEFTAPATNTETRTLLVYLGGYNGTGKLTATLSGASMYSVSKQIGNRSFDSVVTLRFRADTANATLTVRYSLVAEPSKGAASVKLQAAALQGTAATPPPSGSATLTWTPPTKNTNGTTLTDLTGFKVYWGTQQGVYTHSVVINNPTTKQWTLNNLAKGTWYFAVSATAASGQESSKSNVASKVIQ
jgi:hypothetical protein